MSIIYLVHPQHGAKIASLEDEAILDEMNGWTRYNPDTPDEEVDVDEPVNEMAAPKRRGRPRATQDD